MDNEHKYDDIIELPHHVSKKHPPLSRASYAAQFSPFAALTGYDRIVAEAARTTDERIELGETEASVLSLKLRITAEHEKELPVVTLTYFKEDGRKKGGAYIEKTGAVKRVDEIGRVVIFTDGTRIPTDDVTDIKSGLFSALEAAGYDI